jgi:hypothetical protein
MLPDSAMASRSPTPRRRFSVTSGAFNTEGHKGHEDRRCEQEETEKNSRKDAKVKKHANVTQRTEGIRQGNNSQAARLLVARGLSSLATPMQLLEIDKAQPCTVLTFAPLREIFLCDQKML